MSSPVDLSADAGSLARRFVQAATVVWVDVVSPTVTPVQFAALNAILAHPGRAQRAVGEAAGLDRSNIADVVSRLVQHGMVRRSRDPDDVRRNLLTLTQAGRRVHTEVAGCLPYADAALLAPLTPDERAQFLGLLARIVTTPTGESAS